MSGLRSLSEAFERVEVADREPRRLRARIEPSRGVHRSPMFVLQFDIGGLIDSEGRALVSGEELEEILFAWCRRGVRQSLEQGRARIPNHP